MRNKGNLVNIDNSDLSNYPNGRVKNNDGSGNGTPVNEITKGDQFEFFDKAMRLYGIDHNNLPDNETNGYQTIEAIVALASKNDFVLDLTSNTGVLNVALKLGKLLVNESFIFKATINKTTETQIKGTLDNITKTVSLIGDFKSGEYVRAINTASNIVLVRLADAVNIDTIVGENNYLKKASQAQEDAGAIDTVATTPLVSKTTFGKRVNNATDSVPYLATAAINGLYSKEHFAIVAALGAPDLKNRGWFSGINPGTFLPIGTSMPVSGQISSSLVAGGEPDSIIFTVTMANAMSDANYLVRMSPQTELAGVDGSRLGTFLFRPLSTTTFSIIISEFTTEIQNIKLHLEVIQL